MRDPKLHNWYKLTYERRLKKFPNHVIMKEHHKEYQHISDTLKRIIRNNAELIGGRGKIKILSLKSIDLFPYVLSETEVIVVYQIRGRVRQKGKSKNLFELVIPIKTDLKTMSEDIDLTLDEREKLSEWFDSNCIS